MISALLIPQAVTIYLLPHPEGCFHLTLNPDLKYSKLQQVSPGPHFEVLTHSLTG